MKKLKFIVLTTIAVLLVLGTWSARAGDSTNAPVKPYPLKTCLVCDMELGSMGKPYAFVYKGQEIKICDASEKEDFDKDPAKYMKKLANAAAKLKKQ
jgi:YHS domain-containing protein